MKIKSLLLSTVVAAVLLGGCAAKETTSSTAPAKTDATASASVTDNGDVFAKSIGKDGKWIIATTKDLKIDKDLVLEGEFKNGKKDASGKETLQRKIALYTQDDKKNVTARFTLTAPKLTVKSPQASIQHGTFKGDLYVETSDFQLVDAKVDGNVYFKDDAAKAGFKMDGTSSVTGKQEVKK
jgi:major membrane immunogen (membrane-anchored lipoprotein)